MRHANSQQLRALGRAVRRLRERQNMGERELARTVGLTPRRLAAIEAGRHDPSYDVLLALARGLRVQASELADRADVEAGGGDD